MPKTSLMIESDFVEKPRFSADKLLGMRRAHGATSVEENHPLKNHALSNQAVIMGKDRIRSML